MGKKGKGTGSFGKNRQLFAAGRMGTRFRRMHGNTVYTDLNAVRR